MIKKTAYKFLKSEMLFNSLLKQDKKFSSNIYFVAVNPAEISQISIIPEDSKFLSGSNAVFGSYWGCFDLFKRSFSKHFMYLTVKQMLNGKDWETTPYFKKLLKLKSHKEALKHLYKLENLIQGLSEKGYMSQYELGKLDIKGKVAEWEIPIHEMLIGMDRKGKLFRLKGGRHRLAIAQNIKIQEMPAILTLYHRNAEGMLPAKRRIIRGDKEDFRPFS